MARSLIRIRTLIAVLVVSLPVFPAAAQDGVVPAAVQPNELETQTSRPCTDTRFTSVFRCIGHDVRGMARPASLRWLIAGGALAGAATTLDDDARARFATGEQSAVANVGEHIGEAGWQIGVPLAAHFVARATGHQGAADLTVLLVRAQVVNGVFTRGLKMVPRARPYQTEGTVGKGSFPSGHTSASFATATVLQRRYGWRAGVPAFAVASFVGATRLQNVHYLSDVTFGALLGVASGMALDLPDRRFSVAPLLGAGVTGVSISIVGD